MIKNVKVYGLEDSIKASKYPMSVDVDNCTSEITEKVKSLAMCEKGTGHDNFLNGIIVQFDLTFSNKAWIEIERYHFMDFVSSQSTMHCISKMDIEKQCNEYVLPQTIFHSKMLKEIYLKDPTPENYLNLLYNTPSGFMLTARMTTNYRQLKTIYSQRKYHKLPEWREFCKWIETLPYSELITSTKQKAKWLKTDDEICYSEKCSACGWQGRVCTEFCDRATKKYCPNCGAEMEVSNGKTNQTNS